MVKINAAKKSGTNVGALDDGGNIVSFTADGTAEFIIDENGNYWFDGAAQTAFDNYCDAQVTRALSLTMDATRNDCTPSGIIQNKWDGFTSYNEQTLIDMDILGGPVVGVGPDERGLVNGAQLQRLHNGAIWQLHSKLNDQSEELAALKGQITALMEGK